MDSAFDYYLYINPDFHYQTVFTENGITYWVNSEFEPYQDSFNHLYYYSSNDPHHLDYQLFSYTDNRWSYSSDFVPFSASDIISQNWDVSASTYRAQTDLNNQISSIWTNSLIDDIVELLPIVLPVLFAYLGIRKAIKFLRSSVSSA